VHLLGLAPPEIELKRQIKAKAREELVSESNSDDPIVRSDVDTFFAPESIIWYPYEVEDYCWSLAWLLGYKELMALAVELVRQFLLITEFGLWGCFLLDTAHETVLSTADAHRCGKLMETLMSSGPAFASILDAAERFLAPRRVMDCQGTRHTSRRLGKCPSVRALKKSETAEVPRTNHRHIALHFDERRKRWFLRFPGDERLRFRRLRRASGYYCRLFQVRTHADERNRPHRD